MHTTLMSGLLLVTAGAAAQPVSPAGAVVPTETVPPIEERVEHHYVDNQGVKIHYVSLGEGPLLVMLHGFPDFWYTWRDQMDALSKEYRCVAVDLRGYNRSDHPAGVDQYAMPLLLGDVAAVVRDCGEEAAIICGHDWGGAIAWQFAMWMPDMTERLIILNLPHPAGMMREFNSNSEQQKNSQYARNFQKEAAHEALTPEGLASWVTDESARPKYIEAFERSDFEAMLNYYKANFPRNTAPRKDEPLGATPQPESPNTQSQPYTGRRVACPILMIHGLEDKALLAAGLNDTWEWVDGDLTINTIPGAGHFVQQDASELVSRTMRAWLNR